MVKFVLSFLLLFGGYTVANAEDVDTDSSSVLTDFLFLEGIIALNSAIAMASPEVFGTGMVLLSPLAMSEDTNMINNSVAMGGAISLGLYNGLELNDSKYSNTDVFVRNVVGWHLVFASMWLSHKITDEKQTTAYIAPSGDGLVFSINHRF